ncbi:MAG: PAS domain S-box protein [Verrucomicrobia bacterium]|nr:PAS domain S-box protein [Verrucomicrobiota bacterium]
MSTHTSWPMPEQIENAPSLPAHLQDLGILIVDDQADHLELMEEMLLSAGYQNVFTASDGQEALKVLKSDPGLGLVLLDLVMPGIDGYEVCRRIKQDTATQNICVIVVTGGAIQIEAALCQSFDAGATDFISKPLNRFDLLARSQAALTLYYEKEQNAIHERDLALREEKYRSLFESSIDAIFVLNPLDLLIKDLNPAAESLFGFKKNELIGRAFTSLCPKRAIPDEYKNVGMLSGGESLALETQKVTVSGEHLSVEIKFSGYRFQGESRIMAVASDISPRIQAVEDLKLSEERLALAVMDTGNGIWDWDIVTGEIYFSENWRRFLGLRKTEETNGMSVWEEHVHPAELERVIDSMRNHWKRDSVNFMEEHRLKNNSGNYRWVLSRGKAVWNAAGEVVRMAGSLTDITEKKLLEMQVVQMQKMEGLDRFGGGVAHDLNNMVMVVNSCCRFIEDAVPQHTGVSGYLEEIRRATDHSSSLVKQLMAFSRKSQIQLEYVFLNFELENLFQMVETVLGDGNELVIEFEENLPPILADHTMISQVLLNLAINGRDAMPDGGKFTLDTSLYHLEESLYFEDRQIAPGEYLRLSVSDNGVGMEESTVDQIFDPFFTTKISKEGHSGTGLGLSTVYGIMKQHNGWISVKSRPGIGTRFDLFFPVLNEPGNGSSKE